ncbi:MAG TPA: transporter, partial [Syntrophomonas sp.]|nr:transporter [Syntrophomonas sp.]
MPKYRHELKIGINSFDKALLSSRLSHVMRRDRFAGPDGSYVVRSLYFDDIDNHALMDKFMGAIYREKFRIRTY